MHDTLEQLRERNPGKWLLIRLDGPEGETGTVIAANKSAERIEAEMGKRFRSVDMAGRPLYVTYSSPKDETLPAYAL